MATKHERLSEGEEREIMVGLSKSLPLKGAADYAGVSFERLEGLMVKDEGLKKRVMMAVAKEQGRVLDLMKAKSGDVKALAFLLERVYGLSLVEAREVKKEKTGNQSLTITPAVLKALAGGSERLIKRN